MTDLTPKNYAYLLLLRKAGGEITNAEMEKLYGFKLLSPNWEPLNGSGWVETRKSRSLVHRLTRQGEKVLDGDMEIQSTKNDPLARVLPMLHDLLRKAPAVTPLSDRIRAAYGELCRDWVQLADLRRALADVPRDDLDRTLRALYRNSEVRLESEPHRHRITPA